MTTWEIAPDDTNLSIIIPTNTDDYNYDYTVNFGDGNILTNQTNDVIHTYQSPGIYTVSITGIFPHFNGIELNVISIYANYKLLSIDQWGDIQWKDMSQAFINCHFLDVNATDAPDLTQTTSLSSMFYSASVSNGSFDSWDVSNITDMSLMFKFNSEFNQPLNSWDTSNVTNMSGLFADAGSFNQPLNNWDVSSTSDMSNLFFDAESFNQPLNLWDVSNVTNMSGLFINAKSFNQPLNDWNISKCFRYVSNVSSC